MDAKKIPTRAAAVFYALVMLEVFVMISPFAVYFYSFYSPLLQGLHNSSLTAWATSFFLPHSVFTTSKLLEIVRWSIGKYLVSIGMLGFFVFAIQLYWAKSRKKGVVKNFIYSYIRHPQYLFLNLFGLGLLTVWPRIIILMLYIGMLFAYFALAKIEEHRMISNFPEYINYIENSGMFLPGNPGKKIFNLLFGRIPNIMLARSVCGLSVVFILMTSGLLLRNLTIANSAITEAKKMQGLIISVFPKSQPYLQNVLNIALAQDSIYQILEKEGSVSFTVHILPENYGMVGMFADVGRSHEYHNKFTLSRFRFVPAFLLPFTFPDLKDRIMGTDTDTVKVVFSRIDKAGKDYLPPGEILYLGAKMTPVLIVDIDVSQQKILGVIEPPHRSFWGDIAMPIL